MIAAETMRPRGLQTGPALAPLRVGMLALGGLGGSSRVACELARSLDHHGHRTCVLSRADAWWRTDPANTLELVPLPVPHEPRPAGAWVSELADALAQAVLERQLQVLSVHYGVGLAAAAVEARRRLGARGRALRLCVTLHGTDVTHWGTDPVQGPALARALAQCDAVTAVSGWLADRAHARLGLARRPEVIANGIDTGLFRPATVRTLRPRPVLLHASNFRPVKRPLDAIETLERLGGHGVDAELWMIGAGPLHERAQADVRARGLDHRVRFFPPMAPDRLAALMGMVDLSLVTSASESFGLFALESMACGVPVLATRCGGLQEVFDADPSGALAEALMVDVGDVDALARRAAAVLSAPDERARLRRYALALGRTAFPQRRQRDAFAAVFERITGADPR